MERSTDSMVRLVSKAASRLSSSLTRALTLKPLLSSFPRKRLLFALTLPLCLTLLTVSAFAQQNPLHRRISLELDHKRLDESLDRVAKKGQFTFSYRSDLLPLDSLVSIRAQEQTVRNITEQMLGPGYNCKSVGNHVVIRRAALPRIPEPPQANQLDGFLIDANSGEKIRFATVYDNASKLNSLSDAQGHYALTLPGTEQQAELNISRRGYYDTLIVVNPSRVHQLTVGLRPYPYANQPLVSREPDLLEDEHFAQLPLAEWLVGQDQLQLTENLEGRLHSFPMQVSLLPRIGTNRLLSGAMENVFSLNIFAGYSNGVNGFEVGGFVNIDRENVRGLQVGGLANVVGGNVHGLQVGGLMNNVRGDVNGLQVGGLVNRVSGTVSGLQVAGIYNHTPNAVKGMQVAGIGNYSPGDVSQVQIGGIFNFAKGDVGGFQIGGIANYAGGNIGGIANYAGGNIGGFQIGGITNYAKGDVGRFQISGIANIAQGDVNGFQIVGIVNKAQNVKGFQIGLINIADSVDGFCVGLFNAIKHGYKVIEFSRNDVTQASVSYKAGTRKFYNILSTGYRFGPRHFAVAYGAGFGTSQKLGRLTFSLEETVNQVVEEGLGPAKLNLWLPTRLSLGLPIKQRFELFAGIAHNLQISKAHNSIGEFKTELCQDPLWRTANAYTMVQGWLGYQVGFRIVLGHDVMDKQALKHSAPKSPKEERKSKEEQQ